MTDRPGFLILVTHAGQAGVELWSAHYTTDEAARVHERLSALLGLTTSEAHIIAVPETDGVTVLDRPPAAAAPLDAVPAPDAPTPAAQPFRRQGRPSIAERARQASEAAAMGIARDADEPFAEGGASS